MSKADPKDTLQQQQKRANARRRGRMQHGWICCLRCGLGPEHGEIGYDGLHAGCRRKAALEVMPST